MNKFFNKLLHVFLFLIFLNILSQNSWDKIDLSDKYWVSVPVCDATIKPANELNPKHNAHSLHESLSYSISKIFKYCPRADQFKFNQVVTKKRDHQDELEFEVSNAIYSDDFGNPLCAFCSLKKNLISLSDLKNSGIDINIIPDQEIGSIDGYLIIDWPWRDPVTKINFSAGTKFVRDFNIDSKKKFGVKYLNRTGSGKFEVVYSKIPKDICITKFANTDTGKIDNFVKILTKWAERFDKQTGFVPYVWGGNSFRELYLNDKFELFESTCDDACYWKRTCENSSKKPHCGFDCSNLIKTAAQLAGINYKIKNTATLMNSKIYQVRQGEKINKGDVICYPGHVIAVIDPEENLIVEAAGYGVGYGKVQILPVSKAYKGVNNIQDLLFTKPLYRLNNSGEISGRPITEIKIFRLINLIQ